MKKILLTIFGFLLFAVNTSVAQVTCTIPCWQQSFPYNFCDPSTGLQFIQCSTFPNDDPPGVPVKAYIPGCVAIYYEYNMDTLWQPSTAVPVFTEEPPDRQEIWDNYIDNIVGVDFNWVNPWDKPYDDGNEAYWGDSSSYAAAIDQWQLDSAVFFAGDSQEVSSYYYDGNDNDEEAVSDYFQQERWALFNAYHVQYGTYQTDSTAHARGTDVPYVQPWSDAQAATDAQNALNHWLGVCQPPIAPDGPGCCIHVNLDPNPNDFSPAASDFAETRSDSNQEGFPQCGEASCPDLIRFINVNTSPAFLYQTNNPLLWHSNPAYKLHSAPTQMWYTGTGHPMPNTYADGVDQTYFDFSFYQLMEHEIGHWLGLMHPESGPPNGSATYACTNCYTNNPYITKSKTVNPAGFWTVMAQGLNFPGDTALLLTNEDSCQFKKLYCPADVSVKLGTQTNDWFHPEIFPNPSSGGMTLTFNIISQSFTQISIYDLLGKKIKEVLSDYSEEGPQSISLGTETLPSGNYVCRVHVGERVSYINLVIKK